MALRHRSHARIFAAAVAAVVMLIACVYYAAIVHLPVKATPNRAAIMVTPMVPPPHRPEIAAIGAAHIHPAWTGNHLRRNCLTLGAHLDLFCWTSTVFTRWQK